MTTISHDRPTSSRIAITIAPTIMIGADTIIVKPISTSICTCWTSLVSRVISDGAPKWLTSRAENEPTRCEDLGAYVAAETHRRTRGEPDGDDGAQRLRERDREHQRRRARMMKSVSPVTTPLSMISALMLGR